MSNLIFYMSDYRLPYLSFYRALCAHTVDNCLHTRLEVSSHSWSSLWTRFIVTVSVRRSQCVNFQHTLCRSWPGLSSRQMINFGSAADKSILQIW